MNIILILILLMVGIGILILKMRRGPFTDGFVGSKSRHCPDTDQRSVDGFIGSSSSNAVTSGPTNMSGLLGQLAAPVSGLCSAGTAVTKADLEKYIKGNDGLAKVATSCEIYYGSLARGGYVVNTCLLAEMYVKSVAPLLLDAASPTEDAANLAAAQTLTASFCGMRPDFDNDMYEDIVKKFNNYEDSMNTNLKTVSLDYKYNVPIVLKSTDYSGASQARYNSLYPRVGSPKSYGCETFNSEEQALISKLKKRIFGTPTDVTTIANTIAANLCMAKGYGNGTESQSYKGCGTGCLGCCKPSANELSVAAAGPITGTGAVRADGGVGTGTGTGTGAAVDAKCPQTVLREYVLKRKPAHFKKVPSPTDALFECFEDGGVLGERSLDMREAARTAKANKRTTLMQHM
jgi:hypothetical protein